MIVHTGLKKLARQWRAFGKAEDGNVAIIFGMSLIPLVGLIGAAVDYSQANSVRSAMQTAADSTALAISKNAATQSASELQAFADSYYKALFSRPEAKDLKITATYSKNPNSEVLVKAEANVTSRFMNVAPFKISQIPVSVNSTTTWGNVRLRVALALDNTGSMAQQNKMPALKTAAKNLIDQLQAAATVNGDVYVSIIPFNTDVNVGGSSNYTKDWVRWSGWGDGDDAWDDANGTCSKPSYDNKKDCVDHNKTWTPANHNTWNGCVADRDKDYDVSKAAPATGTPATLFPAHQASECPVELMPLTYNWTQLKSKIDNMTPDGYTNITIGLVWGWQSLAQTAPLNAPAEDPNYQYQRVIILLTDGDNTQNRFTSTDSEIDKRTKKACDAVKADGVTLYTILVMQGNATLLQQCASDNSKYFYLTSANQLTATFNQIGTNLTKLRVAK